MNVNRLTLAVLAAGATLAFAGAFTPFAIQVTSVTTGLFGGGEPTVMLGTPHGLGSNEGATHVYQLGVGGSTVLELDTHAVNGPGTDLIVYENPFLLTGETTTFVECLYVDVSSNGFDWARFPNSYTGDVGPFVAGPLLLGASSPWYRGLAGVMPAGAGPELGLDATDVVAGGGDAFDLADLADHALVLAGDVNLDDVRFVRLTDVVGGVDTDSQGNVIWDCGDPVFAGADVDAVAAVNNQANLGQSRPEVELSIQNLSGLDYLFVELRDSNGLWTIEQNITASGDGIPVNFYELLPFFVLLQVDNESATLAAGPIPNDLSPVLLKVGAVDFSGKRGGDGVYLP